MQVRNQNHFRIHVVLLLFFAAHAVDLRAQQSTAQSQYEALPPRPGETCIVCGIPLTDDDVALLVRGRRVPLNRAMVDSFMNNQEQFFSRLQPRSALFQENLGVAPGVAQGGISWGWFAFGLYVVTSLISAAMSAYCAIAKGLPAAQYFFVGLFLNIFGYVYVKSKKPSSKTANVPKGLHKVPVTNAPHACPECGGSNHPSARACLQCGAKLSPAYTSEASRD